MLNPPKEAPKQQLQRYSAVVGTGGSQKSSTESDWKTVTNKRRRTGLQIVGNRPLMEANLKSAPKKAFLHVSRLHPDTTADELKRYLQETFLEVTIEQMTSKFPQRSR